MTNEARRLEHVGDDEKFAARLEDAVFGMRRAALKELALSANEMPGMRGVFGDIGQALETTTGSNASGADAPGLAGQGGHIGKDKTNSSPMNTGSGSS